MGSPTQGVFVSQGGLPSRITQPEPSPLTRAAFIQSEVVRELSELRQEMAALAQGLQQVEAVFAELRQQQLATRLTAPLSQTREVSVRVARVAALLGELEHALTTANETVQTLREERGQLQSLCVIAEHLNSTIDRPALLERVLDDLLLLVRADRGGILLANAQGTLHFEAARAANQMSLSSSDYVMSRGTIENVWKSQRPLLAADAQHDDRVADSQSVQAQGIRSIMCAPLRAQGKALGIVYVDRLTSELPFTEKHLDLLAAFCNEAAIAIENANLFLLQRLKTQEIAAIKNYTDSVLSSINSGVLATDNEGRVTRANPALERILGIRAADVLGQPFGRVLSRLPDVNITAEIEATARDLDVQETRLVRGPIAGQGSPKILNVGWSALCDSERRRLGTVIVLDDLTEFENAKQEAQIFRRYIHPDVVDRLTKNPNATDLGGEEREISVVFTDLRGFTSLGERLDPAALVDLLNDYLAIAIDAILARGGTITMFEGDAVMAIFNAPNDQPEHPWLATQAAWDIVQRVKSLNLKTGNQHIISCKVGVHTGPALVGNIGAAGRLQSYTAIGDTVNTAKRLEEAAKNTDVLLSETTYQRVKDSISAQHVDTMTFRGKKQPLGVWEMLGPR